MKSFKKDLQEKLKDNKFKKWYYKFKKELEDYFNGGKEIDLKFPSTKLENLLWFTRFIILLIGGTLFSFLLSFILGFITLNYSLGLSYEIVAEHYNGVISWVTFSLVCMFLGIIPYIILIFMLCIFLISYPKIKYWGRLIYYWIKRDKEKAKKLFEKEQYCNFKKLINKLK